jgi:hypothetical protein
VYPFRSIDGQGERRSVSFNINYYTKEQIDKEIEKKKQMKDFNEMTLND